MSQTQAPPVKYGENRDKTDDWEGNAKRFIFGIEMAVSKRYKTNAICNAFLFCCMCGMLCLLLQEVFANKQFRLCCDMDKVFYCHLCSRQGRHELGLIHNYQVFSRLFLHL